MCELVDRLAGRVRASPLDEPTEISVAALNTPDPISFEDILFSGLCKYRSLLIFFLVPLWTCLTTLPRSDSSLLDVPAPRLRSWPLLSMELTFRRSLGLPSRPQGYPCAQGYLPF